MDAALQLEVAAFSRQNAMNAVIGLGDSDIQRFYNNSVVFLTGGSGFLGKQLIEKLLRSCRISKIFMLLRPKKGKNIQQRLDDVLLEEPVFDLLRKQQPDFAAKIVPVEGDVGEIKLGLRDADWNTLTGEVDVVFHVAATTKFDETLRVATLINVRGTREILLLGKACKRLKTYVHVSTAYSHATTKLIGGKVEEEFYKAPVPPETLISMAESMEEDRLTNITTGLIKNWPNTYTFTKSISEELVRTMSAGLPICIVRPAVVVCSYTEPNPGWLDLSCVYGASGFILGAALGVLHTIQRSINNKLGLVPCDYVNNAIIAAGRETATNQAKGGDDTRIYTVCSVQRNPVSWGHFSDVISVRGPTIPSPKAIYYNYGYETSNKLVYMILSLFLHLIPAYIVDFVCFLMGKPRRFAKTAKKVYKMCTTLSYFMKNEWQFPDDNTNKLFGSLSKHDKDIFNFDITDINWTDYVMIWCVGVRKYLIKDELKDTEYAIKKQKIFKIFHYVFMTLYLYGIWKLVCLVFNVAIGLFSAIINFV